MERTKMPNLRNGSKGGFEPGLSRLRVRRSTAELSRPTSAPLAPLALSLALPFRIPVRCPVAGSVGLISY